MAEMQTTNPGCVYLMKPGLISSFSGANVNAPSCGILVNDTASFSSATIKAQSIRIAARAGQHRKYVSGRGADADATDH